MTDNDVKLQMVHSSKASAMIVLNTTYITEGEVFRVKYENQSGQEDSLVALGVKDGIGPDCYILLSDQNIPVITSFLDHIPDISEAITGAVYVVNTEEGYVRVYCPPESSILKVEKLKGEFYFSNLDDGKYYFFDSSRVIDITKGESSGDILKATNSSLEARIKVLEKKVSTLSSEDSVVLKGEDILSTEFNSPEANILLSSGEVDLVDSKTIFGSSVTLEDIEISGNRFLAINSEDIVLSGVSVNGDWNRKGGSGNAMVKLNDASEVIIKDVVIGKESGYNAIEIGLDRKGTIRKVVIDNLRVESKISNNAILIFSTADDAEILITNSYFKDLSNLLRLSNATNSRGITVTLRNCIVDHWDTDPIWNGAILMEDYTSQSESEAYQNNLYGNGKITIILDNLIGPEGEKIMTSDISSICPDSPRGRQDGKQVIMVYYDKGGLIPYDPERYPEVIII